MQRLAEPRAISSDTGQVGTRRIPSEPPSSGPRPSSWQAETVAQPLEEPTGEQVAAARREVKRPAFNTPRLAAAVLLMLLVAASVWALTRVPAAERAREPAQPVAAPEPAAAPPPETSVTAAPPIPGPPVEEPPAETRSDRRERKRREAEETASKRERPRHKVDCTEPFVVDAQGIRRVKRECL
jgi:hypothetical protein